MAIRHRDPVWVFGKRLMALGLFVLVVLVAGGVWNAYQKERESSALRVQAEGQLKDLTDRKAQLNADIANLQTDRGVEGVLREQYALAAKGEGLIVIVDQPVVAPKEATSTMFDKIKGAFRWW